MAEPTQQDLDHPRCEQCDRLLAVCHGDAISDEKGFPICEDCGGEDATPLLDDNEATDQ